MSAAKLHRAVQVLHRTGRDYPNAWRDFDEVRARRAAFGDWPAYIFCPLVAAIDVARRYFKNRLDFGTVFPGLAALASWRPTQGIYRFHPDLLEAVWDTPVSGDLPVSLLHRLPEWCVYLELGQGIRSDRFSDLTVLGAWAHLDLNTDRDREELRLLLDVCSLRFTGLYPLSLPLVGTLDQSIRALGTTSESGLLAAGVPQPVAQDMLDRFKTGGMRDLRALTEPIVSVILYLCARNAEIRDPRDPGRVPARPIPRIDKHGRLRCYAAEQSTLWETGVRLGSALAAAKAASQGEPSVESDGPSMRPHIRRAHWHSYWVGAHDTSDRHRELRWLPPIPVNLDDDIPDVATVRPVRNPFARPGG